MLKLVNNAPNPDDQFHDASSAVMLATYSIRGLFETQSTWPALAGILMQE
jgi:hypothetical protein